LIRSILAVDLGRDAVAQVAELARLRLDEQQLERLTVDLAGIVHFLEQLDELDTEGVEPLASALDVAGPLADDIPAESLPREAALANAPKHDGECFRVPAVL